MEKAIYNSFLSKANEKRDIPPNMMNVIKDLKLVLDGKEYVTVFYSFEIDDGEKSGTSLAKFKNKTEGEKVSYALVSAEAILTKENAKYIPKFEEDILTNLKLSDFQDMNLSYMEKRFAKGSSYNKNIHTSEVEGQSPNGVVPFEGLEIGFIFVTMRA